jgi:hypothetical protein
MVGFCVDSNCESATPKTASRELALIFWISIATNSVASVYASIQARGLYSDGVAYLVGVYQDRWFLLFDTRTVVQLLRQAPIVFASRYTSASLFECGQLFSLVMLTLPWFFCLLCWFILPKDQKQWILFPLLAALAGFMATSVHAVGEAAIAAGYEWLILFVLLFRAHQTPWLLLWIGIILPAFRLHEGTFTFLTVIVVAAVMAFRSARSRLQRAILGVGVLYLIGTIAYQIRWVIFPQFQHDRDAVVNGLLHGEFLYYDGHFNLQLINGLVALLILTMLGVAWVREIDKPSKVASQVVIVTWVLFCIVSVIFATMVEQSFAPFAQLQARYHPPLVGTLLASIMVGLLQYKASSRFLTSGPVVFTILLLSTIQLVADLASTERWNAFVADLRVRLSISQGLIPWETTLHTGDARADINWQLIKIGWVVPYFSIVYAPNGVVRAIINSPIGTEPLPFNPAEIKLLPPLKGIDYAPYEKSLLEQAQRNH